MNEQPRSGRRLNWKRLAFCGVVAIGVLVVSQLQQDPIEWWIAIAVGFVGGALPIRPYSGNDLDWFDADDAHENHRA